MSTGTPRRWSARSRRERSIKQGRITVEEGKEFLNTYRSGLYGYTYLE